MQDFEYIDETLDTSLTQSYILSIQVSLNGFSFCILDKVRKKYIVLKHINIDHNLHQEDFLDTLEDIIENNELLNNNNFLSSKLIFVNNKSSIIPTSLFNKNDLIKYIKLNHHINELDEIHYQKLSYINAYSVFTIPNLVANIFAKKFKNIKFYNQNIPFINFAMLKHHNDNAKVSVNFNNDNIDIAVIKNGELLLSNNFKLKNISDATFYIMYVFKQLELNPEKNHLFLSGLIDKTSAYFLDLKKYVRFINFEKKSEEYTNSYTFKNIYQHTFLNLQNLINCE
ncbi:MAG: DUF3822 family protein [Bacteroidota bacterium]|nr:DUF3822 family protein [Bacteroidota bacterium]